MPDPVDLYPALAQRPWDFDFFQALRLIECAHPDKPRIGQSRRAREDVLRLGQQASLGFAPAALAEFRLRGDRLPLLLVHCLGLFGPNGPLPLHLTEYAREREHNAGDPTFARFADVFHNRMLALFYRAWAAAQPTVSHDRDEGDRFADYLASLLGMGTPALRKRDALPDAARLHFAGLLANQARSADGLRMILGEFLRLPVRIVEFVGHWLHLPREDRTRIGLNEGNCALGESTVLGARVFGMQHKFRIEIGPVGFADYRKLLPGGVRLAQIVAWVRSYAGDVPAWDLRVVLKKDEVPPLALGGGASLGWTSWLGTRRSAADAADLVLTPQP